FASVWHSDINVAATRLGGPDAGTSRTQWLFAAALSRALDDRWNVVGELSGTRQGGVEGTRQLLVAASYNVSRRFVVDAGAARSLRAGAPVWSAFTGFTWLATRVF
ncbi:MAG TPA: transporter, partial [Caldimonas sp.]